MDFSFTESQKAIRTQILEAAQYELNENLRTRDIEGSFSHEAWQRIAELGVLGAAVPVEYGGQGRDFVTAVAGLEALGEGCSDNGLTLAVAGQMWAIQDPIVTYGTTDQKQRFLPGLVSGRILGAHAMTEPHSGSDTFALEATAERSDEGYVINGFKTYIGLAPISDLALVFAKTAPDRGKWGISAFLIPTDLPGVTRSEPIEKMGLRTSPLGSITFEDCMVPRDSLLGSEGAGAAMFSEMMEWERSFILAGHVGSMARQIGEVVEYARTREQFGRAIGQFQSVSNRIANMRVRLEVSRLLMYKAAWLKDQGQRATVESAIANLYIAEAFVQSSIDSIRTHGAIGYLSDSEVERDLRDAMGGVIYSGTSDIQRTVIARMEGL